MNAARENENGLVENLCQTIRKISYSPIPNVSSTKMMHDISLKKMLYYNNHHCIRSKRASIIELSELDKLYLMTLPSKEFMNRI
jgi:hypothetical protein